MLALFVFFILCFQPLDDIVLIDEIHDGREGDGQKDARDTQQAAADHQGNQDPHGRDTQLLTEQTGLDHIAVQRLQDQCKNQEQQSIPGLDQYQDESTDDCPDHGAEGRRQVCHTDDDRNDRDIGHTRDHHEDPVAQTDDHAVQKIEGDVLDQDLIAAAPERCRIPVCLVRQQCMEKAGEPFPEPGLVHHQIDCQNEGNDPVKHLGADAVGGIDNFIEIFRQDPCDRLQQLIARGDKF